MEPDDLGGSAALHWPEPDPPDEADTGKQTAILNNLNVLAVSDYEEILYTNASGSMLLVTDIRPGQNATVLRGGRSAPIPWSAYIGIAAW